jgi:hypothetical protein
MHQAKITKTDQKVQPRKTKNTDCRTTAAATPQTCALLDFYSAHKRISTIMRCLSQMRTDILYCTTKKNDCPRPFPHIGHKGNRCLWYINNLSNHFHYENDCPIWTIFRTGKCMSVRNLKPLSELERHCSS